VLTNETVVFMSDYCREIDEVLVEAVHAPTRSFKYLG
jgi:hypothetical protein